MWQVTLDDAKERAQHHACIAAAGADDTGAVNQVNMGPTVVLWRRFRDGTETREALPQWLAECTLATIPEREPNVERAKMKYGH